MNSADLISLANINVIFAPHQLQQPHGDVCIRDINCVGDVAWTQKPIWLQKRRRREPGELLHRGTQLSDIWTEPPRGPHLSTPCSCRWRWLRKHKGTWGQVGWGQAESHRADKSIQSWWFLSWHFPCWAGQQSISFLFFICNKLCHSSYNQKYSEYDMHLKWNLST